MNTARHRRRALLRTALWLSVAACCATAHAQKRIALVIGNGSYSQLPPQLQLQSPAADAADTARALASLGYQIVGGEAHTNLPKEPFRALLQRFALEARGAEGALFYYSGHGVQVGADNYLLPTDTPQLTGLTVLKNHALRLRDTVMTALEEAGAVHKILILDCCRDNPFAAQFQPATEASTNDPGDPRDDPRTLLQTLPPGYGPGFYLAFATSPGWTTPDGNGRRNSPFTEALLKVLPQSRGRDIDLCFREVKRVLPAGQVSWTTHSLQGAFSIAEAPAAAALQVLSPGAPQSNTEPGARWVNGMATPFRWCPPAELLTMGRGPEDQKSTPITEGFWLSEHEVTQTEWRIVTGRTARDQTRLKLRDEIEFLARSGPQTRGAAAEGNPLSLLAGEGPDLPVYCVSWEEAADYCARLTQRDRADGRIPAAWRYSLPSESQWEYACRAGSPLHSPTGTPQSDEAPDIISLDLVAWHQDNSRPGRNGRESSGGAGVHATGTKQPNAWGLHDMLGNVWEWCADATNSSERALRGGGWTSRPAQISAAARLTYGQEIRFNHVGFRPALVRDP